MKLIWIVYLIVVKQCLSSGENNAFKGFCISKKEEVLAFIYPDDYQTNEAPIPSSAGEEQLKIQVHINVWTISDISLLRQDFEVDLILTILWRDKRLSINPNRTNPKPWIRLGDETTKVWRPTLLFRNCKGCSPLSLGIKVPMYVQKETGQFWAQERILTKFSCGINLQAYPMDKQKCAVLLYTNERSKDVLLLEYSNPNEKYIMPSGGVSVAEFFIPFIVKEECIVNEDDVTYSCLQVQIPMERLLGYHLITSFAPTTFIVILSWISFWIPVDVVPARIALGLTSLLTLATRLDQAQKNLPPVSYVKAIDVWMFACISMVSSSLLEFAVAYYRFRLDTSQYKQDLPNTSTIYSLTGRKLTTVSPVGDKSVPEADGTKIDRISRVAFPLLFIIFNICYWSYYLSNSNNSK